MECWILQFCSNASRLSISSCHFKAWSSMVLFLKIYSTIFQQCFRLWISSCHFLAPSLDVLILQSCSNASDYQFHLANFWHHPKRSFIKFILQSCSKASDYHFQLVIFQHHLKLFSLSLFFPFFSFIFSYFFSSIFFLFLSFLKLFNHAHLYKSMQPYRAVSCNVYARIWSQKQ